MKSITVGQLRQNPTEALAAVGAGETYRITRHNREVGRIVPPGTVTALVPPRRRGPARTSSLPPLQVESADTVDALIADMKGDW
ncbi:MULTISPECIES: type II toxin-antitoxin system Phd/YefM family antitoxin [Microbacterium]|jgi:prevent-host-death family protein|uniref:type II toxin-antitoxin system Phd/YefM family antitoxin n=1 Tax=Microbacterium TaxID=33882 RepID=UPI000DB89266|nr:type II toxin-antitoxin system prevent-host-death family antitoxin [Microbacterium aurum]PZU44270.1 MAG: prevent-host-death family protein [Microbacterium sp.]